MDYSIFNIRISMKKIILAVLLTFVVISIPSCTDLINQPTEPRSIHITNDSYIQAEEIKERPNRDSIRKDSNDHKRDTSEHKKDTSEASRKDTIRKAPPTIFGDLLVKLNISPEQRKTVESLLIKHRMCVDNCVKPLKDAESEIFRNAKLAELEIKKALNKGKITKAKAREKLASLKKRVADALKNLPMRTNVQECIKACDTDFINHLEKILSSEQRLVLKSWIDSRTKRGKSGGQDSTGSKPRG